MSATKPEKKCLIVRSHFRVNFQARISPKEIVADMSDLTPEASLTLEYCALQIATLIERSKIKHFISALQFSPSEISYTLNELPYGMNMDFHGLD